jgi:ABC-type transporter Mla subunit MlaD
LNIAATSIRAALKETESLLAVESKGKTQEASIKAGKIKELEDALNSMIRTLQKFESTTENNLVKSITQTSSKIKEIGASLQKSDQQLKRTVNSAITELKKVKPAVAKLKAQGKNDRKS